MVTWPLAYRQASTNAVADLLDGGTGTNATLEIGDTNFSNVLLIFNLQEPACGDANTSATATVNGLPITGTGTTAAGTGITATEYRYKDKAGTVGPSGTIASGEITISDTNIIEGNTYRLVSANFTNS